MMVSSNVTVASSLEAAASTISKIIPLERWTFTSCPSSRQFQSIVENKLDFRNNTLVLSMHSANASYTCDFDYGVSLATSLTNQTTAFLKAPFATAQDHFRHTDNVTGLSLAFWIRPSDTFTSAPQPLITLGRMDATPSWAPACPGYGIQLSYYQEYLMVAYTDQDAAQSCRIMWLKQYPMTAGHTHHVVLSMSESQTNVYLDGSVIAWNISNQWDTHMRTWEDETYLQVLGNAQLESPAFRGSMLQLDLFDQALSADQVHVLFHQDVTYGRPEPLALQAWSSEITFSLAQDSLEPISIQMGALNVSQSSLSLFVEVLSGPRYGSLLFDVNQTLEPFQNGTFILLPIPTNSSTISLSYKLHQQDYFNDPPPNSRNYTVPWEPESIVLRVVARNRREQVIDVSPNVTVPILVQHVNHEPQLVLPEHAMVQQFKDDPTLVIVNGVQVLDAKDYDLDYVRVDVACRVGNVTLNRTYRDWANFDACRQRSYSDWQCVGTSMGDRRLIFVALPSQVEFILQDLQYQGFVPGHADDIEIHVYDGQGEDCLSRAEHAFLNAATHSSDSLYRRCFHVYGVIAVPEFFIDLEPHEKDILGIPNSNMASFGLADLIYWIFLFLALGGCLGTCNLVYHCCARGAVVDVDDMEDHNSASLEEEQEVEEDASTDGETVAHSPREGSPSSSWLSDAATIKSSNPSTAV
jgi:hypothetical protein